MTRKLLFFVGVKYFILVFWLAVLCDFVRTWLILCCVEVSILQSNFFDSIFNRNQLKIVSTPFKFLNMKKGNQIKAI